MSSAGQATADGDPSSPTTGAGVRRHHTISASSRAARISSVISEEQQEQAEIWNDDEVVDQEWVGGVGAVGEKSGGLHRQASLPTKYHRAFQGSSAKPGTKTPTRMNSLSAIAGHDGDEEEWERDISTYRNEDQPTTIEQQQVMEPTSMQSSMASHIGGALAHAPSPPPAASGVRRHQSLTYGAQGHGAVRHQLSSSGLRRSGTLQAQVKRSNNAHPQSPSPTNAEEDYPDEGGIAYDDEVYSPRTPQGQFPTSPIGRASPWGSNDWRAQPGMGNGNGSVPGNTAVDDVQRALSSLELSGNNNNQMYQNNGSYLNNNGRGMSSMSDFADGRQATSGYSQHQQQRSLGGRSSNPNLNYNYQQAGNVPSVPPIPQQYLQQNQQGQGAPRMGATSPFSQAAGAGANQGQQNAINAAAPVDVPTLIATKGYNPPNFDIRPQFARFFVIKSYTEDDVHKSLKYEIWSSTDPGNKRLDKAFKETAGRGPIYLFFSVNASGHFCGMAEMLTPVDYTRSSTVWASDKWKGVFKVRWIFVRDIPNSNLRHIKLNNTQERKPVTNSRDTQELLPDAGQEMLRIFHTHPARTSLLQDFAFYELQAMQKGQNSQPGAAQPSTSPPLNSPPAQPGSLSPVLGASSPAPQQQQNNFGMGMGMGMNGGPYAMQQMNPMMQMQMQMNMGMGMGLGAGAGNQFGMGGIPQQQAMHQSVLRHPSPGPGNGQNYMGAQRF